VVKCDYCGKPAELVKGREVYPGERLRHLWHKDYYHCRPCGAYVGCHTGTTRPLGRLANAELRRAKIQAHEAFDRLWRGGGFSRSEAYRWLAEQLEIEPKACHIGYFDVEGCQRVAELCGAFDPGEATEIRRRWAMIT
jgi:hypothetical protein